MRTGIGCSSSVATRTRASARKSRPSCMGGVRMSPWTSTTTDIRHFPGRLANGAPSTRRTATSSPVRDFRVLRTQQSELPLPILDRVRPDGAIQVATSNQVSNYHDQTVRPAAEMIWEVMTYAAHGVQCTMVDKSALNGVFYRVPYERMRPAFAEVRETGVFQTPSAARGGALLLESQPGLVRAGNPAQIPRLHLGRAPRLGPIAHSDGCDRRRG